MEEEAETFWENTGKRIMAATAFIGSTKIKVSIPFPFWFWGVREGAVLLGSRSCCTCSSREQKCSVNGLGNRAPVGLDSFEKGIPMT